MVTAQQASWNTYLRIPGWPAGDSEQQRIGHAVIRRRESVGHILADDRISPEEVAEVAVILRLPGGQEVSLAMPLAMDLIEAVADDERIDLAEVTAILAEHVGALLPGIQGGLMRR